MYRLSSSQISENRHRKVPYTNTLHALQAAAPECLYELVGEADGEARSRSARTAAPRQDRLAQPVTWTGGVEGRRGPPGGSREPWSTQEEAGGQAGRPRQ